MNNLIEYVVIFINIKKLMKNIISKINRSILSNKEIQRVNRVMKTGLLAKAGGGPIVKQFQKSFAKCFKRRYAFATSSGTTALHIAVSMLKLKPGDEVIIPALANIADASVLLQENATPVFADIEKDTFCIDPNDVVRKISKKTKAIIVVHIYGQPANIEKLLKISKRHNLILIEDCAQAIGAKFKNKFVGNFGDLACFSFYQTKNITCGEGGMVITDNKKYADLIDSLLDSGLKKDDVEAYNYDKLGYNYRLTEIQAAIGLEQLKRLVKINRTRRRNTKIYQNRLKNLGIIFQREKEETENVYFYLTGLLPSKFSYLRDGFIKETRRKGVPIKKLYPLPLPKVDLFKEKVRYSCPVAEDITKRLFNLYVNPGLTIKDIVSFCETIKGIYRSLTKE